MEKYAVVCDTRPGHGVGLYDEFDDYEAATANFEKWRNIRDRDIESVTLMEIIDMGCIDLDSLELDDDGYLV